MKRIFFLLCAALILANVAGAQIPSVTLRQVQQVPFDSLVLADALQNTNPARWTLQRAPAHIILTPSLLPPCAWSRQKL
jgi:hypothetical protein